MSDDITDLTRGVYRRHYASYIFGKRINAVSLEAEAWFWRIHDSATDDFGNTRGDAVLVHAATAGVRKGVTVEDVRCWLREMKDQNLIRFYVAQDETYLHVVDFLRLQPSGRNGKRIRRVPKSPWDESEANGGIRGNPGASSASDNEYENDNEDDEKLPTEASAVPAKRTPAATSQSGPAFLEFPTIKGKRTKVATWNLTEDYVSELSETFTAVDVRAECRKALAWVRAKPGNRKTAGGMREFLLRWMSRAQDRGRPVNGGAASEDPASYADRVTRNLKGAVHA